MKDKHEFEREMRAKYGEDVEVRTMEVRASDDMVLEGYAATFNDITDLGYFREQIATTAFDSVLSDDVRYLLNHDGLPLARTTNGTLELSVDDHGLFTRATLSDTQTSRDVYAAVKRGDISEMSFAFTVAEEQVNKAENLRTVTKVARLFDVSPVTYPAYPTTSISARSAFEAAQEQPTELQTEQAAPQPKTISDEVRKLPTDSKPQNPHRMNFKTSQDAQRYIDQLDAQLRSVKDVAAAEERALDSDELAQTQEMLGKIEAAEEQRDALTKVESRMKAQAAAAPVAKNSAKELDTAVRSYSLGKALREAAEGKLTGLEAEMAQEARSEISQLGSSVQMGELQIPASLLRRADEILQKRAGVYGVDSTQSGVDVAVTTVGTDVLTLVGALRSNSLLNRLGATELQGFTGDIKLPSLPTDAAQEPAEGAALTGNTGAMGAQTLSPARIGQQMKVTRQAFFQTTGNMMDVIAADFGRSIANVKDKIAFNAIHGVGGATTLAGGTGTVVKGTETGTNDLLATTSADVRNLWATITANGAENNTQFVAHPTIVSHLMSLANVSSVDALVKDGKMLGYNLITSGSVPSIDAGAVYASQLIDGGADVVLGAATGWDALKFLYFGDWSDMFVATWGGLDVTIDPYTLRSEGNIKIVVDTFFDAKVRRAGSIGALPATAATILGADS